MLIQKYLKHYSTAITIVIQSDVLVVVDARQLNYVMWGSMSMNLSISEPEFILFFSAHHVCRTLGWIQSYSVRELK